MSGYFAFLFISGIIAATGMFMIGSIPTAKNVEENKEYKAQPEKLRKVA